MYLGETARQQDRWLICKWWFLVKGKIHEDPASEGTAGKECVVPLRGAGLESH